jgi:hypothetical protein
MPVRRLLNVRLALVLALVAAGAVGSVALAGGGSSGAGPDIAELDGVEFISVCPFSHRAPDDPIVLPRQPDRSHDHTFLGNVSTDAFSTAGSLRQQATTCQRSEDTAAYWAPTLSRSGKQIEPAEAVTYYRRTTLARARAFPPGLMVVAGDAGATRPQSLRTTFWDCGEHGGVAPSATVPDCPDERSKSLRLNVRFPDCWDGVRLDSADHKRHMAYSQRGRCPATHRVALPTLTIVLQYPITGGADVALASGGQLSGHADFINAWDQKGLSRLVESCLNALRRCERSG